MRIPVIAIGKPIGTLDSVVEEVERLGGFSFTADSIVECSHHLVAHILVLLQILFCLLISISNR